MAVAAPTVKASTDPGRGRVGLLVTATDPAAKAVSVTRTGPDGKPVPVRTMVHLPLTSTVAFAFDDEVPLEVPVTYRAYAFNEAGEPSPGSALEPATVPYVRTWLKDVARLELACAIQVQAMSTMEREVDNGVHYVLGRRSPVTVADVPRLATFSITLVTLEKHEREDLGSLLAHSPHMLFQGHPDEGGNLYVLVTKTGEERATPSIARYPERLWSLECVQTDAPASSLVVTSQNNYQTVLDTYATYDLVMTTFGSYLDLLQDIKGAGVRLVPRL